MNEAVNTFLLAVGTVMTEMHLRHAAALGTPRLAKKEFKNSKKQEIHDIFIETN